MFERIKYMDYNLQKFTNGLKDLEITLTDKQLNQFLIFYKMYCNFLFFPVELCNVCNSATYKTIREKIR